ncbi:hypothetical protein BVX93_01335 [bacterium B13(2017)]|nr:hypothetical protein BVX93_01335 [bacterium B13(2017)]
MQTLSPNSKEYKELKDKIKDPEIETKTSIPLLEIALKKKPNASHERQRDIIKKHLKVGTERDRYIDSHLKKSTNLTKIEILRYQKMYSSHPKSEMRKATPALFFKISDIRGLKPKIKLQLIKFYLSNGNRKLLSGLSDRDKGNFLDVANYLFDRDKDDQAAFFENFFIGKDSVLHSPDMEVDIINDVLLAGEAFLPREKISLLTALYGSFYYSLDPWDRGQLLSQLIVESQTHKGESFFPPSHSPERAVKILRLIKGFGPKAAQILRSHKGILGESKEAQKYRDAFEEFEEKAQRIDLKAAIKNIELSFGDSFHKYFKSIDGILGAGSVKKVLFATLNDGRKVAIKYRDRDYNRKIQHSLNTLKKSIQNMEEWRDQFPELPILESILSAVEEDIEKEQNLFGEHTIYRNIKSNLIRRSRLLEHHYATVPLTHEEIGLPLTDGSVVVEEAFELISIEDIEALMELGIDQENLIYIHITELLEQLIIDGFFDYDTRPANWMTITRDQKPKLGYFDKAQGIQLNETELEGLMFMLMAIKVEDSGNFIKGFIKFENKLSAEISQEELLHIVDEIISLKNPYLILQKLVFSLEKKGIAMSNSYSLKLTMWLRQLDRYLQIVPNFDIVEVLTRVLNLKLQINAGIKKPLGRIATWAYGIKDKQTSA